MQMLSAPSEEAAAKELLLKMCNARIITPWFFIKCMLTKKKQKNKTPDFSISKLNLESSLFKASLSVESLFF